MIGLILIHKIRANLREVCVDVLCFCIRLIVVGHKRQEFPWEEMSNSGPAVAFSNLKRQEFCPHRRWSIKFCSQYPVLSKVRYCNTANLPSWFIAEVNNIMMTNIGWEERHCMLCLQDNCDVRVSCGCTLHSVSLHLISTEKLTMWTKYSCFNLPLCLL